ncbi:MULTISPECIES: hypothetical protein [unclassified Caballeronia]|uniref:hypothetical protein n=1 Tax=unclassified Caballeronia TaxID=2646786 RepID=UPI002854B054|nr:MULTISPECIES: hypothetical protein [unclassified Caballeronia]MDR5763188.1 hypothetical protein [Caballeronia sp. LZ035]MDR5883943.1 hypothetical protein [Caballeronia sp. LZ032]
MKASEEAPQHFGATTSSSSGRASVLPYRKAHAGVWERAVGGRQTVAAQLDLQFGFIHEARLAHHLLAKIEELHFAEPCNAALAALE